MPDRGFLIIADITGYTRFLTGSELDHAQGVLEDLFAVILERLKSPLALSNIQGDAFFAFANDDATLSPGQILDSIEALYFGFRERLTAIIDNTTCPCRACSNAGKLDLKFIVHHGEYVTQTIAERRELTGPDVILVHRLVKNDVVEQTGISSYALFTAAAVDALGLEELKEEAQPYTTDLDEFGHIEGVVVDFGGRWKSHFAQSEVVVADSDLWFEPITRVLPFNAETVWAVLWHPDIRTRWNSYIDSSLRVKGDPKRVRVGAVDHCAHGKDTLILRYIDVRPLKHVTIDYPTPMGGFVRRSTQFSPEGEGTRITIKWAPAQGPNPLATAFLRFIGRLRFQKRIQAESTNELKMLEAFIADQAAAVGKPDDAPMSLSDRAIKEAARGLAAGQA